MRYGDEKETELLDEGFMRLPDYSGGAVPVSCPQPGDLGKLLDIVGMVVCERYYLQTGLMVYGFPGGGEPLRDEGGEVFGLDFFQE